MSGQTAIPDAFWPLVDAACDSTLVETEVQKLAALLSADSTVRKLFIDHMHLRRNIRSLCRAEKACDAGLAQVRAILLQAAPPDPPVSGFPFLTSLPGTVGFFASGWPVAYMIATVIVGIGLWIGSFIPAFYPEQVAGQSSVPRQSVVEPKMDLVGKITGMVDCKWAGTAFDSPSVPSGRKYELASGLMEITYDTGARVILQGPATYEVESASGGYLSVGKLTGKATTTAARGLTIRTPSAVVTDLGTEFGVEVSREGLAQVHVLRGAVDVQIPASHGGTWRRQKVTEGFAVQVEPQGKEFEAVAFAPRSFARNLPVRTDSPADTAYIQAVLADKPLGYWPLNEPAGARKFLDRSGNGFHGYAVREVEAGTPGPLPGQSRAVSFDGQGYIDVGLHEEFALQNDFTVEAWLWISKVERYGMAISIAGSTDPSLRHLIGWSLGAGHRPKDADPDKSTALYFTAYTVRDMYFSLPAGEALKNCWHHVAVVFDRANTAHLHLDGRRRDSIAANRSAYVGPVWISIGNEPLVLEDREYWQGRLAHIAVYPRALSIEQIQNHYDQGKGGNLRRQ